MDDRRFDALAKRLAGSRRVLLKKVVGLGAGAALIRLGAGEADAARRGFAGPGGSDLLGGRDYYTFCNESAPACCIQCYMSSADVDTVRQTFLDCAGNSRPCADCARAARPSLGGTCWVA